MTHVHVPGCKIFKIFPAYKKPWLAWYTVEAALTCALGQSRCLAHSLELFLETETIFWRWCNNYSILTV